jgi:tetratricopeptide (TPR) repeat protein
MAGAHAVAGATDEDLITLVDHHLVQATDSDEERRYRLLETVREYAYELLGSRREAVERALVRWMIGVIEEADLIQGVGMSARLRRLDAELDNLRSALDVAIELGDLETELRLAAALWRFWQVRGHLAEGRARLEEALLRPGARATAAYSRALFGAGILAWALGDYMRGRAAGMELLEIAERARSKPDEHNANKVLSMIALRLRDFEACERYALRTIEVARELGNQQDLLTDRLNYAVLILDWCRVEEAIPMFEEALGAYRRIGYAEGIGLAQLNLGEAASILGQHDPARDHFEAARAAFESIGFRAHVGHALRGLAAVEAAVGNFVEAAELLGRADATMADVGWSEDDFTPSLVAAAEASARAELGDEDFRRAFERGRRAELAR